MSKQDNIDNIDNIVNNINNTNEISTNVADVLFDELSKDDLNKISSIKNMDLLYNVPVTIKAKLGSTKLSVEEILKLDIDSIILLNSTVGDAVEVYANDILIGYGEIVVVNEDIGIKITQINVNDFDFVAKL